MDPAAWEAEEAFLNRLKAVEDLEYGKKDDNFKAIGDEDLT